MQNQERKCITANKLEIEVNDPRHVAGFCGNVYEPSGHQEQTTTSKSGTSESYLSRMLRKYNNE
jgi:hypothetical protein